MLMILLALTVPVSVIALLYTRWEYSTRGRLSLVGLFLLCTMLFVPNLVLHYAFDYRMPSTTLDYIGVVVAGAGLLLCVAGVVYFWSIPKMLCLRTGVLTIAGPYRWSRNPQYVGWIIFLLGFALNDWSPWAVGALLVVTVSLHFLVLIEEEHLLRTFGEPYATLLQTVPRYLGRPRRDTRGSA